MIPFPGVGEIVAMVTAVANAVDTTGKLLLSPEGQAQMKQWRDDRAKFEKDWNAAGDFFKRVFSGDWLKALPAAAPKETPTQPVKPAGLAGE